MKYSNLFFALFLSIFALTSTSLVYSQGSSLQVGLNRIEGRVMDENSVGVNNVYVELYSNFGTLVSRQRSTGQGRFSFYGMGPGRYTVSVKPYGTNLREDSRDIEINNQYSRSDTQYVDFRLREDKPTNTAPSIVGTVFAQEVPEEAQKQYRSGIEKFKSRPDEGLADLESAVKIFPQYFDALAALGKAYVVRSKYDKGYPYLIEAINVNRKCADCYYSLSLAAYKLNLKEDAKKAIDAAVLLQANEPSVRLLQGMIYNSNKDYAGAEKALLAAKTLYKEPNPEVHWQLALVYNRLKRNTEAADQLEIFLKHSKDLKEADKKSVRANIEQLRAAKG